MTLVHWNKKSPIYSIFSLPKQSPEYWNNLGSFRSRCTVQEDEVQSVIEETLRGAGKDVTYELTDGSCRGNSVPCGAGACLFFPIQEKLELHQPVSERSSILLGDLVAIKMTLEAVQAESKHGIKEAMLFLFLSQHWECSPSVMGN